MAGKTRRSKLVLTDEDKAELEQLARSRTAPHREKQRAAILLGCYGGESIASIGRRLGMTRLSVSKWVAKALDVTVGPETFADWNNIRIDGHVDLCRLEAVQGISGEH